MYGTPNNSIYEFGMRKNVILASCMGVNAIYILKRRRAFDLFLAKSMLVNYTINRNFQHNAALYLSIF